MIGRDIMRTVLFLINGFGIEKHESYSLYDSKLMPNFDMLTKKYIFSPIDSNVRNIYDGFRNMSLETGELYNYSILSREMENGNFAKNKVYVNLENELRTRKSKLHVFCFIDNSMRIFENLRTFIKIINKEHDKKIFFHLVLTSNNFEDFPSIIDIISKINIELGDDGKIGMVMGLSNILNNVTMNDMNFLLRNMISELGEKWSSYKQRLEVSFGMKQSPLSTKPFVVNTGFSIEKDDLFLIWNYDNLDISNFISGISSINYGGDNINKILFYSMFPITYKETIPHILDFEIAKRSLAMNMKGLGFKTLVLTSKNYVSGINYYLNGLTAVNNPNISYMALDNNFYNIDAIINIINTNKDDLVVLNYELGEYKTVDEMKEELRKVDSVIGAIYNNSNQNNYNIIISSLYGLNRVLTDSTGEICNIIYSKVPLIYIDKFITKKNYLVNVEGTISGLFRTCYKSIDRKYPGEGLIIRKNLLYRIIFK